MAKYYYGSTISEIMRRIAIYGKGGIGKSTVTANLSLCLAEKGLRVMQIGCDPKADSTSLLLNGEEWPSVLEQVREGEPLKLENLVREGEGGVLCVECGGPSPGVGCAGRGIIAAFETLESLDAFEIYKPDVVIYDVLGDVVCGGFAMPIRSGYARDVFIVSSGERMALYAARNIAAAVENLSGRGYARLSGIIQNSRGVADEDQALDDLAVDTGSEVIARIPRDPVVQLCEDMGKTVIAGMPDSPLAQQYRAMADSILAVSREDGDD